MPHLQQTNKAMLETPTKQMAPSATNGGAAVHATPTAASVASFSSMPPLVHTPSTKNRQHPPPSSALTVKDDDDGDADTVTSSRLGRREGRDGGGASGASSSANHSDRDGDDPDAPIKIPSAPAVEEEECCLADILLQMIRNYLNGGPLVGKIGREDLMAAVSMCLSHSTPLVIGPRRSIGIIPLVHLFPHRPHRQREVSYAAHKRGRHADDEGLCLRCGASRPLNVRSHQCSSHVASVWEGGGVLAHVAAQLWHRSQGVSPNVGCCGCLSDYVGGDFGRTAKGCFLLILVVIYEIFVALPKLFLRVPLNFHVY